MPDPSDAGAAHTAAAPAGRDVARTTPESSAYATSASPAASTDACGTAAVSAPPSVWVPSQLGAAAAGEAPAMPADGDRRAHPDRPCDPTPRPP